MILDLEFHHFGVACRDIDTTAEAYEKMGYLKGQTVHDPLQNVRICFLTHPSMPMVELLAPVDDKSPVVDILRKNGTTPYHTCYETKDLDLTMKTMKRMRYIVVSKPKVACAIDGRMVAFLYNAVMGLVELVEKQRYVCIP